MEVVFLGTSCMVPTKERNHQSMFITHKREGILLDCGEGTQKQLKLADIKPSKITKIFITHWHGDHVLGLPGLLQTLNASDIEHEMTIYGPVGTKDYFENMYKAFSFRIGFAHKIHEIKKDQEFVFKDIIVKAKELKHSVPCIGYSFKEKDIRKIRKSYVKKIGIPDGPLLGNLQNNEEITWKSKKISPKDATYIVEGKKLAVVLDTLVCKNAYDLAKDADTLVCEASYTSDLLKKAEENMHMTAEQAGLLASQSGVKKLVLTHFSQRYKTAQPLVDEAKLNFKEVVAAFDMMKTRL